MSIEFAFVSIDDEPLELHAELDRQHADWSMRVDQFGETVGGRRVYTSRRAMSHTTDVVGIEIGDGEPPLGWRKKARDEFLTPDLRRKAGKDWAEKLKALRRPSPFDSFHDQFGAPEALFKGLHIMLPGMELLDGRVWITYGADPEWDGGEHFRAAKLSEYYAAKEAQDAPV
jgi:hypothetical protein